MIDSVTTFESSYVISRVPIGVIEAREVEDTLSCTGEGSASDLGRHFGRHPRGVPGDSIPLGAGVAYMRGIDSLAFAVDLRAKRSSRPWAKVIRPGAAMSCPIPNLSIRRLTLRKCSERGPSQGKRALTTPAGPARRRRLRRP